MAHSSPITAGRWQRSVASTADGTPYTIASRTIDLPAPPAPAPASTSITSVSPQEPSQQLPVLKVQYKRIDIAGWSITAAHGPIGNAQEMDNMADLLGIPLPEMVFPHNSLTLEHETTRTTYSFDALSALHSVHGAQLSLSKGKGKALNPRATQPGMLKVSHAKEWGKSRLVAFGLFCILRT